MRNKKDTKGIEEEIDEYINATPVPDPDSKQDKIKQLSVPNPNPEPSNKSWFWGGGGGGSSLNTVFTFNISESFLGPDYVPVLLDITRMATIHIIFHILYASTCKDYKMFSENILILLLYIVVGVMVYWLIVRKLFTFI